MKKASFVFCIFCIIALWGCGGEGGSVSINNPAPAPTPAPPDLPKVTLGVVSGGFVEVTFDSPLIFDQPMAEPGKVVGLMDEAVRIIDITAVCWYGDKAGWTGNGYCTTTVSNQNRFKGTIVIPVGDEGNFVAFLTPTSKGSESWFNITKWEWPDRSVLNLQRGTVTFPSP